MPHPRRFASCLCILTLSVITARAPQAQTETVVVDTVLPGGGPIDDALAIGPDGALYGSRFGLFGNGAGTTVTRLDLSDGSTSVYADGFVNANGLAFDDTGALFALSYGDRRIERIGPDGTQMTFATASSGNLSGLLIHPQTGVIYVSNYTNNTVDIVNEDGTLSPFLANDGTTPALNGPVGMTVDDEGRLYVSNFNSGQILRVSDTGELTEIADLTGPASYTTGFIAYAAGSIFATGIGRNVIEEVSLADGSVRVLAGTGVPGTTDGSGNRARFDAPNGIAATPSGDTLYVSDFNSRSVRRIIRTRPTTAGETAPLASSRLRVLGAAPNPSSGHVALHYRLPRAAHVRLTLYDVLGRQVETVLDAQRSAGEHAADYDTSALTPGLYVYRIEAGGEVATGRFVRHKRQ